MNTLYVLCSDHIHRASIWLYILFQTSSSCSSPDGAYKIVHQYVPTGADDSQWEIFLFHNFLLILKFYHLCIIWFWFMLLGPRISLKCFLSFPQKSLSPEKTETNYIFPFQFLNVKRAIWHLEICQNWYFGQFYWSKIEK